VKKQSKIGEGSQAIKEEVDLQTGTGRVGGIGLKSSEGGRSHGTIDSKEESGKWAGER